MKCISLGYLCAAAHYIRKWTGQPEAYPFDWIATPIDSLVKFVEQGPEILFRNEVAFKALPEKSHPKMPFVPVWQREYDVLFFHDFPKQEGMDAYPRVLEKYAALSARWRSVLSSGEPITFVRQWVTRDKAVRLYSALNGVCRGEARLLVLNEPGNDKVSEWEGNDSSKDAGVPWNIPGITNVAIGVTLEENAWGDERGWRAGFERAGILPRAT